MKVFTHFKKILLVAAGVLFTTQAMALTEEEFKAKAIGTWLTTRFVDFYLEKSTDFINHIDNDLNERKPLVIKADGTIDFNFGQETLTYSFVNGNVVVSGSMGPSVEFDTEGNLILFSRTDNEDFYHSTEYHFKSAKGSVYEDFMNNCLGIWFETGFFDHSIMHDMGDMPNVMDIPYDSRVPLIINPDGSIDYNFGSQHWSYSFTDDKVIISGASMPYMKMVDEGSMMPLEGTMVMYSLQDDDNAYSYQGYTFERGTGTAYGDFMKYYLGTWLTRGTYYTEELLGDFGTEINYSFSPTDDRFPLVINNDGTILQQNYSVANNYKYSFNKNGVVIKNEYGVSGYEFKLMPDGFLLFGLKDVYGNLEGYSYSREDGSNVAGIMTDVKELPVKAQVLDGVYSLQGLYVGKISDLKNLPKGIYIVNGKKVLVK